MYELLGLFGSYETKVEQFCYLTTESYEMFLYFPHQQCYILPLSGGKIVI